MISFEVKGGDKFQQTLEKIAKEKMGVKAGIPAGASSTGGKSVVEYALYNELGTAIIPARPFMRTSQETHQNEWGEIVANGLMGKECTKEDITAVLGTVGELMQSHIKETIQKGSFAPNALKTKEAKRRRGKTEQDHPLIDTGQMLESVTHELMDGGEL